MIDLRAASWTHLANALGDRSAAVEAPVSQRAWGDDNSEEGRRRSEVVDRLLL